MNRTRTMGRLALSHTMRMRSPVPVAPRLTAPPCSSYNQHRIRQPFLRSQSTAADAGATEPRRACTACQAHLPLTTTPCTSCEALLPLPNGLSYHSILGLSKPVADTSGSAATPISIPAELATLPAHGFTIDGRDIRNRMLQRQRELHPDKFANRGEGVVQLARDLSGRVNDAYGVLVDPLKRAEYILSVHSMETEESDSLTDPTLLMEVMEAREELESAKSENDVAHIREENEERIQHTIDSLTVAFSSDPPDLSGAKELAIQLRYWRGLQDATKDWHPGKSQVMIH